MTARRVLAALLVCGFITACDGLQNPSPSSAEIESVGILALQAKQQKAITQLRHWAQSGLPVAQREIALVYSANKDNWPDALIWLTKAAANGDREAQFELANSYLLPKLGVAQDYVRAWILFEKAAMQGDGKASLMLARMARHGWGQTQDAQLSAYWLQEASRQKNPQAMYELSVAYAQGDGLPRNNYLSRYWLNMSAEYDYKIAMQALALELDGLGGNDSPFSQRSRQLLKEANDHRLMRWNTSL
jgi:hypothetical protein